MADYENLLDSIDAVIRTNNRREITGQILQNTLHQMVNSIGANYQLAGFAEPSTNPNSPDQNVFYIAEQAGVYPNFGNITLETGLSFLMWKNSQWTSHTIGLATQEWIEQNYVSKAFLRNMFRFYDEDGNEIFANDTISIVDNIRAMVGLWTEKYLSALGRGDDGGGGGGTGDVTWALLADNTDTRQIALSHLTGALSTYATQSWVTAQLNAMEYVSQALGENGLLTLATNKGNSFVIDLTHQHSWFEIQDRPTTLAGYGLSNEVKLDNGVITIAGQTITPVTSVAMTVPLGLNVSGSPITKTGTFAVTYASGYEGFTTALKQKIEALFSWFEVDENGNVKTKDYTDGGTTKHRGFYSPSFISALGMGDDGSAGSGDVTWALLADNTDTRQIAISHLTDALAGYATQSWVLSQGFLTEHQSLANYYTKSETNTAISTAIGALEYINQVIAGDGMFTLRTNKSNDFVLDLTHQHSWFELQDKPTTIAGFGIVMTAADIPALDWSKITTGKPTTLSGYGITDAYINNGTIYLGTGNITPVTQVTMTVPAGFNISGSPLTKTGTLGLTYATGYEGFTTDLKNKINALFSWFEVDENGDIKTKDYTSGSEIKHRGFYSPSFISALGQGSDGSAGQGDVTWALLADETDTRQIALSHLTTALSGYATQAWVNGLGFATQTWVLNTALSGYATQSWVQNTALSGYATQSWVTNTALDGYATQAWVNQQGFATTAALNALEFLNSITSVEGAVTFSTNKNNSFVLDLTHSHSWFDIQDRPTTISGFGIVMSADDIPALDWSKITTGKPTTLAGYGITDAKIENGVITLGSNAITPVTSVAMTMPTGFNVSGSPISKTGTFAITYASGYEGFTTALKNKIDALFSWFELDSDGNVKTKDWVDNGTTKHRGFYSPSFISALGQGNDGSAGSGDVTWALLADSTDTRQIALSHLTTALGGYATQSWVNGLGFATQSWVNQQGFATQSWVQSQGYTTAAALNALEFVNNAVGAEGYVTFSTNKNNSFIIDFTHQHSWFEVQDRPDTFAGFGLAAELSSTLSGYVTQATFNALEYMNQATGADGVLTLTTNKSNEFIVDFTHQHSFLELVDRPTTLAGYGITDATIANLMGSSSKGGSTTPVYWNGSAWVNCTSYGSASVNYATSAGSASSAAYATSAGSASSANYATSAGSAGYADYIANLGNTSAISGTTTFGGGLRLYSVYNNGYPCAYGNLLRIGGGGLGEMVFGWTAEATTGGLYYRSKRDVESTAWGDWVGIITSAGGQTIANSLRVAYIDIHNTNEINCSYGGGLHLQYSSNYNLTLCYGGGNVGIGTNSPSYKLHVAGTVYATGGVTALSDARKKDIQGDVNLSVEQIALAPAVKFLWKDKHIEGMQAGTIAQYWQGVLPEVVTEKNDVLGMSYGVAALIASIVTAKKVVDHERRIKELERENEILKNEVKQLKAA